MFTLTSSTINIPSVNFSQTNLIQVVLDIRTCNLIHGKRFCVISFIFHCFIWRSEVQLRFKYLEHVETQEILEVRFKSVASCLDRGPTDPWTSWTLVGIDFYPLIFWWWLKSCLISFQGGRFSWKMKVQIILFYYFQFQTENNSVLIGKLAPDKNKIQQRGESFFSVGSKKGSAVKENPELRKINSH